MIPKHPRPSRLAAAVAALVALAALPSAQAPPEAPVGSWEGRLTFRDEPLALRLDVARAGDGVEAELDLPDLVYADQPAAAELRDGALAVELPFGLGEVELRREGERLVGRSEAGIAVELRPAEPFAPRRETLAFGAAEPAVEGTLVVPPGDGPFPLVLLAAGAGSPHRGNWSYTSWADPLARRGVASLAYDRRPDDELDADGALFDLDDHGRDLSAALDELEGHPRLDLGRVAVLGKSRGAWIGLTAAARDPRIDLLVALGGAAVGVAEQDLQRIEATMRADGAPEEDVEAALAYTKAYFHVAAHPDDWPRLARAAAEAAETPWGDRVRLPERPEDLDWFAAHLAFDPLALLADLEAPAFYAWGADDRITPPGPNRPLVALLLGDEVRAASRLVVYDGVGHSLEGPLDTDGDGEVVWSGTTPRLLPDLLAWLGERGFLAPAEPR